MVKRVLLSLGFLAAAHAGHNTGHCVLNGGLAMNDMADAAVFTWAATERCGKAGEEAKCEIDAASAVESATGMVEIILKAAKECHSLHTKNPACGFAATSLTKSLAGLAAASGGIIQQCPNAIQQKEGLSMRDHLTHAQEASNRAWAHATGTTCLLDVKDSMRQLLKAVTKMIKAGKDCDDDKKDCSYDVLGVVAALGGMGRYLMGAVGHCSHKPLPAAFPLACAEQIDSLISHLTAVAAGGQEIHAKCTVPAGPAKPQVINEEIEVMVPVAAGNSSTSALYDAEKKDKVHATPFEFASPMAITMVTIALPLTAVLSFVLGARFAKSRSPREQHDFEALSPMPSDGLME